VAETHWLLDQSAKQCDGVSVVEWYGEWSVVNADERLPEKRYRLYTRFNDKLVCVPDAAFLVEKSGHRKVFYLEQDRDTTKNADRVAAQKHAGYAKLAELKGHLRHFPAATLGDFTVLMIAPTVRRRDALRKAFAEKMGAALWKFASQTDLSAVNFLTGNVWQSCEGEVTPLLRTAGGSAS